MKLYMFKYSRFYLIKLFEYLLFRFTELLLIPKSPASSVHGHSSYYDVFKEEELNNADLKDSMRELMKQMVKQSVNPVPFKRPVNIAELERALCVLYHMHIFSHIKPVYMHQSKAFLDVSFSLYFQNVMLNYAN